MTFSVVCAGNLNPVTCNSMGAAINTACDLIKNGAVVLEIKGSDGFRMDRSNIELECSRRAGGLQT